MTNDPVQSSFDWLSRPLTNLLAWWIPRAAIVGGLFVPVLGRTIIWSIALIWMVTACILNARRCRRTHCRYTGPYYLLMTAPVVAVGSELVSVDMYAWLVLAVLIFVGASIVWWAKERAWGPYS